MKSNDLAFDVKLLKQSVDHLREEIKAIKGKQLDKEMWDNSDVIRHWKISPRTLASWRAEEKIGYVQVGGKIWYTKEDRDSFLRRHSVNSNDSKKGGVKVCNS